LICCSWFSHKNVHYNFAGLICFQLKVFQSAKWNAILVFFVVGWLPTRLNFKLKGSKISSSSKTQKNVSRWFGFRIDGSLVDETDLKNQHFLDDFDDLNTLKLTVRKNESTNNYRRFKSVYQRHYKLLTKQDFRVKDIKTQRYFFIKFFW
jgi:hypothetical protein